MKLLLLVCCGGAIGSGLRYGTDRFLQALLPQQSQAFPWATLAVNLVGCFAAGIIFGLTSRDIERYGDLRVLLLTGLCGGLTTFSAFALQTVQIAPGKAIINVAVSVAGGLLLAWVGIVISAPVAAS